MIPVPLPLDDEIRFPGLGQFRHDWRQGRTVLRGHPIMDGSRGFNASIAVFTAAPILVRSPTFHKPGLLGGQGKRHVFFDVNAHSTSVLSEPELRARM